jgi:cyanophycinase
MPIRRHRHRGTNVRSYRLTLAICLLLFVRLAAPGLDAEEKAVSPRLRPSGIDGAVLLVGDNLSDAVRERFLRLAEVEKAKLVLVSSDEKGKNQLDSSKEPRKRGFDLLPGTVIVPRFDDDCKTLLLSFLSKNPKLVGVGIGAEAALLVKGREMRVLGDGSVTVCLAVCSWRPARTVELKAGSRSDLTMWRRAALARGEAPFPAAKAAVPEVPHGALVIVGGGAVTPAILRKFIDLAGGPDAPIVLLPTAQPDPIPPRYGEAIMLERAGAKNVHILPKRDLKDIEDPTNLELLRKAKGIWFGGGRQWRFVDAYEGTKAEPLFHDVLRRGGVIGGSSAGASIQAEYMVRGSPLNNTDMMCEGYERGLGFLPGVAVDQHFSARRRFADMTALMKTYPQLLGIGIDEATALVVRGHIGEVMGRGKVHFYDRRKPVAKDGPDYEAVGAGGRYDLKARKVLPER